MKDEKISSSTAPEDCRYSAPCSAQDMTGLIPAGSLGEEELENYEELYPFLPRVPCKGGGHTGG